MSASLLSLSEEILNRAKALLARRWQVTIAIEGRCATGKSTLAGLLARDPAVSVICMDHFFLPARRRTPQRLAQPGGNVDLERFIAQVAAPLQSGEPVCYRPFDCRSQQLAPDWVRAPGPIRVVEGVYSLHPDIPPVYDLKFLLTAPLETRLERLRRRCAPGQLEQYLTQWIPLEDAYFRSFSFPDAQIISTGDPN